MSFGSEMVVISKGGAENEKDAKQTTVIAEINIYLKTQKCPQYFLSVYLVKMTNKIKVF